MVKFKLAISCGGWHAISKLNISKNENFILCNQIIHMNFAAVQKSSIFKVVLTCPGIFSGKWPFIPMFYTCKKPFCLYFKHTKFEPDISMHARKKWGVKITVDCGTPCSNVDYAQFQRRLLNERRMNWNNIIYLHLNFLLIFRVLLSNIRGFV